MATETIKSEKFRVLTDAENDAWERVSFWTKAADVELADGTNLEQKSKSLGTDITYEEWLALSEEEKADGTYYITDYEGTPIEVDIATTEKAGIVKPDGTTITIDEDGTIHGGAGGASTWDEVADKPFDTIGDNLEVVDGALKNKSFTGTKKAVQDAIASGDITEGTIVNVTDDYTPGGGDLPEGVVTYRSDFTPSAPVPRDADTLEGYTADEFAKAEDLAETNESVSTLNQNLTNLNNIKYIGVGNARLTVLGNHLCILDMSNIVMTGYERIPTEYAPLYTLWTAISINDSTTRTMTDRIIIEQGGALQIQKNGTGVTNVTVRGQAVWII